jgi:hypothetical protein
VVAAVESDSALAKGLPNAAVVASTALDRPLRCAVPSKIVPRGYLNRTYLFFVDNAEVFAVLVPIPPYGFDAAAITGQQQTAASITTDKRRMGKPSVAAGAL